MLTKEEALKVAEICNTWPGGLGCVLIPSKNSKRGYKNAEWGWRGRKFGNFKYEDLKNMPETTIYCPVTAIGIMRGAKDFKDHMNAYQDIRELVIKVCGFTLEEAHKKYNYLLSHDPKMLSLIFETYANYEEEW